MCPRVDSASENEYQVNPGGKGGQCVRLTAYHLHVPMSRNLVALNSWNFLITQFLTNHGSFRLYLHKINKLPSPHCNCPEKPIQTAHHLLFNCSLLSSDRPPALKSIKPPLFLQYHLNTVGITNFLKTIFKQLQDELQEN
jgi:hypothetical protein